MSLLYNPATKRALDSFVAAPSHAVVLAGPKGAGKRAIANELASCLLGLTADGLTKYPYFYIVTSDKAVSIDDVRTIEQNLRLRVPRPDAVSRVVMIEGAQTMGHEAQNALLKTLEEPPASTVLILIATTVQSYFCTLKSWN